MRRPHRVIFNIVSILFITSLVLFYGYRFIHFYMLEHKVYENKIVPLYEKLIDSKGIDGTNEGLQSKDDMYIYATNSENNYLYYVGRLWRIVSIDKNNNIKLITNDAQTLLSWDSEELFNTSVINDWLNKNANDNSGIFESSLKDEVNSLMKQNNLVVSLLTKDEYENLNSDNYLKTNYPFWIMDKEGKSLYVDVDGLVKENTDSSKNYAVRPTIVLKSDALYISGTGNKDNPYTIKEYTPERINGAYIGEYVNFGGYRFRIIGVKENVKLVLDSSIENVENTFGKNNIYTNDSGIGLMLNEEFYNSFENKDYIVLSTFNIGGYGNKGTYDYHTKYNDSIETNIGMLEIGDFFINEVNNVYTLTGYASTEKTIFTINNAGYLYADYVTSIYNIRPVLNLDGTLFVVSGRGTKDEPYEVVR